jgi:prophage antirepressor-like protein
MSTQTHLANFNGYPIQVIDHNNQPWLTAEQIGKALGLKHPRQGIIKIYHRHQDEIERAGCSVVNLGTEAGKRDTTVFSPRAARTIAFFCQTEMAERFRCWVLDELEKQSHSIDTNAIQQELLRAQPLWAKIVRYKSADLTHVEIGKLLDCSSETIRHHVRRIEMCGLLKAPENLHIQQQGAKRLNTKTME